MRAAMHGGRIRVHLAPTLTDAGPPLYDGTQKKAHPDGWAVERERRGNQLRVSSSELSVPTSLSSLGSVVLDSLST